MVLFSLLLVVRLSETDSVPLMTVIETESLGSSDVDDDTTAELLVLVVEYDPIVVMILSDDPFVAVLALILLVSVVKLEDAIFVTTRLPLAGTLVKTAVELESASVPTAVLPVLFVTLEVVKTVADRVLDNA